MRNFYRISEEAKQRSESRQRSTSRSSLTPSVEGARQRTASVIYPSKSDLLKVENTTPRRESVGSTPGRRRTNSTVTIGGGKKIYWHPVFRLLIECFTGAQGIQNVDNNLQSLLQNISLEEYLVAVEKVRNDQLIELRGKTQVHFALRMLITLVPF